MSGTDIAVQLRDFCRAHTGDGHASVSKIEPMPGHSGFSWGFTLSHGLPARTERLVLRLAPPGVRAEGPADIVRQAKLVARLASSPVPVPAVRWFGDDPHWFGRPYSVVQLLEGCALHTPDTPVVLPERFETMARQAVAALAELHRLDVEEYVEILGEPQEAIVEVNRWDRFRQRLDETHLSLGARVAQRLRATAPGHARVGVCHGDFQWANVFYKGDTLVAVLDWELAAIGPVLADLAWLTVFSDSAAWGPGSPMLPPVPVMPRLVEMYADAGGVVDADFHWYRASAAFKWAVIIGLNHALHRSGKRPDPIYERLVGTVLPMLEFALATLERG